MNRHYLSNSTSFSFIDLNDQSHDIFLPQRATAWHQSSETYLSLSGALPLAKFLLVCHVTTAIHGSGSLFYCPACRTYEIATRLWEAVICPIYMFLTVYEFSFILFDLCLFIIIFNFILNYVLIVTFWIFTYYKIWIMLIIYCFIWNYWIFYFVTCLEVFWSVMS